MKLTYYIPAHPSYFPEDIYTSQEVEKAISLFRVVVEPGKWVPEVFVFLTSLDGPLAFILSPTAKK